jgi:peroxiredoxin
VSLAAALLVVAIAAWLFVFDGLETFFGGPQEGMPPSVGHPAPSFVLTGDDGQAVSLQAYQGRPVVVNFWATWCVPCRAEMPELQSVYRAWEGQGLAVIGINLGEDQEAVWAFRHELGLEFPLLLDTLGRVTAEYGVRGLPTTLFIGREGRVAYIHNGALSRRTLDEHLRGIGVGS